MEDNEVYNGIGMLCGGIAFVSIWLYCIVSYNFILGVGLGWIPAIIGGLIASVIWPIFLFIALLVAALPYLAA